MAYPSATTYPSSTTYPGTSSSGTTYVFNSPRRQLVLAGTDRFHRRYVIDQAVTVLIKDGAVRQYITPTQEVVDAADYAFRGNYYTEVEADSEAYNLLVDAGYSDNLVLLGSTDDGGSDSGQGLYPSSTTYPSATTYPGAAA